MISEVIPNIAEKKLTKKEMKLFFISSLGGALEFYDFVVYIYFSTIISKLFFDLSSAYTSLLLTYSVFATGYLARIAGGLLFSHYGDLTGRKKSFTFTVFLMAAPTFIIGLLPTYSQIGILATILLFICRFSQGLAIGGEIPCSITFIYEHARKSQRGLAIGILFAGIILGIFLGSSAGYISSKFLSEKELHSWGWRIPFLLGGLLGLIGVYLRKYLSETPVFRKMQLENNHIPIKIVIKNHKFNLIQTTSTIWLIAISVTLYFLYLPNYFVTYYKFNLQDILKINTFSVLLYSFLIIIFGIIIDYINPKIILLISCVLLVLFNIPVFLAFKSSSFISIYIAYLFISFTNSAATAAGILMLANSFPTSIRYTGSAFAYNLAFGIFGGFTPLICTTLIESTKLKYSPAFYITGVALITLILNSLNSKNSMEI
ncbi:MFS transporter [Pigmentibacter sp. JX0631]|uniref:MFS transporter n=1 Tax=Pigmentibacter sp. JX0631 TaxID=2976982 RepID=UPI002469259F|nr:MFS transporter [Pigmentibacter sp. JX0631]WGL60465.1 MFS transporter [Pigmentibacter sp. JX0631]